MIKTVEPPEIKIAEPEPLLDLLALDPKLRPCVLGVAGGTGSGTRSGAR